MEIINAKVPYFGEEGLNCAESSLRLLIERGAIDIPMDSIKLFTGLAGGLNCGGPCGVVVGCTAAIGSKIGRFDPSQAHWQPTLDARKLFMDRFQIRYGHLHCDGLMARMKDRASVEAQKVCSEFVLGGVEIAEEILRNLDEATK